MLAGFARLVAQTGFRLGAFPLRKAEINQNTMLRSRIVEEVGRLDVAMQDLVVVHAFERAEQGPQVDGHVRHSHVPEVATEVSVAKVRQDGHDLVIVAEGCDKGADRGALAKIIQQFQLVEDACGT